MVERLYCSLMFLYSRERGEDMRKKFFFAKKNSVSEVASRRACGIMQSCSSGTHVSKRAERGEKGEREIEDEKEREGF